MLEQTVSVLALCKDFRHFLFMLGITGHCLCEDFPIFLFGGIGAPGIWQRMFRLNQAVPRCLFRGIRLVILSVMGERVHAFFCIDALFELEKSDEA